MSFLEYESVGGNLINDHLNYHNDSINLPVILDTSKLKHVNDIRETLLNLIQKKPEIIEVNNEGYKNDDIDKIITGIDEILPNVSTIQDELSVIEDTYKREEIKIRDIIKKLDKMISFLESILVNQDCPKVEEGNETYLQSIKQMIESVNELSDEYLKHQSLKVIGEKYKNKRQEMNSYIYFIHKLNRWNVCNICAVCLTNRVDHYCNPCGHTACKTCIDKNFEYNHMNDNHEKKCPFCRSIIISTKSLYFL